MLIAAINIHHTQFIVAIAIGGEGPMQAVGRRSRIDIVKFVVAEIDGVRAIRVDGVNLGVAIPSRYKGELAILCNESRCRAVGLTVYRKSSEYSR